MSEMIERVAKAKWARRQEVGRNAGIEPPLADWEDELESLREEVRAETRAGFEAMREPTHDMYEAAATVGRYAEPGEEWGPMIDAALGKVDA